MKKGPLSNKDKEFIEDNLNLSVSKLAEKLERSENSIEQYCSFLKSETPKEIKDTHTMSMYGRNKKYGVVIMTENASMQADESKSKSKNIYDTRKYRGAIHRIREDT
jgi:hypothetical protein